MNALLLARALHVLGVVLWIGGVALVTTAILPAIRRGELGVDKAEAFRAIEHRFVWQARVVIVVVGITGFYMTAKLHLWSRFTEPGNGWMHAMVLVWSLFVLQLFVLEPLILRRYLPIWMARAPERTFAWMYWLHVLLLTLSLVTILAAVAGAHGWRSF